jgi:nucleoside-diphosphate-sugar epimerase
MTSALFGYTGFVGGNLVKQLAFDDLFNSANSTESTGREYDLVVFSAARAEKWRINQDPERDLRHIEALEALVSGVKSKQFVLISTVDVYKNPVEVDEDSPIDTGGLHAYGSHRYRLEQFVRAQHSSALIVRLPGLFGQGLKKNVIFDLLHDNNLDRVHADGRFQYYNLEHLWSDIRVALKSDLRQVNLTSAPIRTGDIARVAFGREFVNRPADVGAGVYDMRTRYAEVFGGSGAYTRTAEQTLAELADFVRNEQGTS